MTEENRNDHFLTLASGGEAAHRFGYAAEGVAFYAPKDQLGTVPVYRWYHPTNGDHFYTANPAGEAANKEYSREGIAFHVFPQASARPALHALHRVFDASSQDHMCTIDPVEACLPGWAYQRIIGYVYAQPSPQSELVTRWCSSRRVPKITSHMDEGSIVRNAAGASSAEVSAAGMAERDTKPSSRFVIQLPPLGSPSAGSVLFNVSIAKRIVSETLGDDCPFPFAPWVDAISFENPCTMLQPNDTQQCFLMLPGHPEEVGIVLSLKLILAEPTVVAGQQLRKSLLEMLSVVEKSGACHIPAIDAFDPAEGIKYGLRGSQGPVPRLVEGQSVVDGSCTSQ